MSAFTLFHTAVSVLPIGFGFAAFLRQGTINPTTRHGRLYVAPMLAGSISSFGFLLTFGFTPGQVLTLLTLALLAVGTLTLRGRWRGPGYVQTIALSTSYLLLMVFATTETLKRFPVGHPFAAGPTDPSLIPVRLALLALFAVGLTFQIRTLRKSARQSPVAIGSQLAA